MPGHSTLTTIHKGAYIQSSDPGAVGAKVLWIDNTAGYLLKKRNDTDTGWDTVSDLGAAGSGIPEALIDALGDLIYGSAADTAARLAGNITTTKKFLTQTGDGGASAAPAWNTIATGDVPDLSGTYIAKAFLDAKGNLISASADNTPVLLTVGTNDYVLTAASGETSGLKWTAPKVFYTVAVSDESTAITTGTAKITFRMPFAMTLTAVRASLSTASSSGNPAIDVNEGGVSIFSTTLTIDANEKTSTTAATPAVISDSALADDAEMTIDIDTAGTGAKGLKVTLIGTSP